MFCVQNKFRFDCGVHYKVTNNKNRTHSFKWKAMEFPFPKFHAENINGSIIFGNGFQQTVSQTTRKRMQVYFCLGQECTAWRTKEKAEDCLCGVDDTCSNQKQINLLASQLATNFNNCNDSDVQLQSKYQMQSNE